MSKLVLENLSKNFADKPVLKEINLSINSGELLALLGPSGCGKTTTLKLIAGLLAVDEGDILLAGNSIIDVPTEKREVVLVFQDYLLFPHLNVADNIAFGLKMKGVAKDSRKKRVTELLDLVNLSAYQNFWPNQLSGGQAQRVALARALAVNPKVLLLDEPFSNLDANLRKEMQGLVRQLHEKEEMTTIFVTHDRQEAIAIADRIAVMKEGRIVQVAKAEELYKKPNNKFVADFFGRTNYLSAQLQEGFLVAKAIKIPLTKLNCYPDNLEDEVELLIRPELIKLKDKDEKLNNDQQQMILAGKILDRKFLGEKIRYSLLIEDNFSLEVVTLADEMFELDTEIKAVIDPANISLLS
ncbi:ABC transporter ATP-binding protein [Fuchsiella alkaliacetigena]|uniref:ABC transporter ATP-binding protein n=1 Tax=Fuchsiella alkaliacetigena TaxID=957042 RepID=UPI00200B1243|nr:ABC transporter ATP-binding protein [Fuchsiella alkaliacetigena]MCK8823844.1 ABC transporter ATP-binding protein [Fuchsiella alkaliacetigena]